MKKAKANEYTSILYVLEGLLNSNYNDVKFSLICNGFDINEWEFTKVDSVDDLEIHLIQLMSLCNINYIEIDWTGSKLKNFFPMDVFTQIVDLQDIFEIAGFNRDGLKMIEISSWITEICEALAEEYDDESYLIIAIEYEDKTDLVLTLEMQEQMLMEYFTTKTVKTDEIVMLYKDFSSNLDKLESIYPGSPFVANMVRFENDLNNLELEYLSEENLEYVFGELYDYVSIKYCGYIFSLEIDDKGCCFVLNDEITKIDKPLIRYINSFIDVSCMSEFTFTWKDEELKIDSKDELPYYDYICNIDIESYDKNGILQVTEEDIIARFSIIHYDLENDVLACSIDDDDLGDIENLNWKKVCKPKKNSQFREKWFYDEVTYIEEIFDEDNEEHIDALIITLKSLYEMNLSENDRQSFIANELRNLGFERLI